MNGRGKGKSDDEDVEGSRVLANTMVKIGTKIVDTEVKTYILKTDGTTANISITFSPEEFTPETRLN